MPLRSDIFDPSGQVDPNSELAKRTQREQAYGQMYEQALGTLKPPAMGAKYMQGPEGKLWQGIEQQQQFGAAQASRRGFNPFAARGATQAGSEMESQGYGAAQGIRDQQEAFRRQAELGLLQQRTGQDFAQAGIESQQLGQRLEGMNWEAAQRAALQAEQDAQDRRAFEGGMGAFGSALNLITSDERMKTSIEDGGPAADALMDSLGSPMTREQAIKYYNTPAGASADQVQMVGEFGNRKNPRTAIVYTGDMKSKAKQNQADYELISDEDYGAASPQQPVADLMAPMSMPIRGVAIQSLGEGGPSLADMPQGVVIPSQQLGMNVRGLTPERRARAEEALGIARPIDPRAAQYVAQQMPRTSAMLVSGPSVSDEEYGTVASMHPMQPLGMSVRGMTPERRQAAEARLGITRQIDPRAAQYVAQQMPKSSAMIAREPAISDAEYGTVESMQPENVRTAADIAGKPVRLPSGMVQMPTQVIRAETPEEALRRRNAEQLAAYFNEQAGVLETKASKSPQEKGSELASAMDAYAKDYAKKLGTGGIDQALNTSSPQSFDYRAGAGAPGRQLGVMAQDMASAPLTRAMVTPTSQGLALNPAKAVGPLLGMVGRLNQRVNKVEGK